MNGKHKKSQINMTAPINQHFTVIDQTHGGEEECGYDRYSSIFFFTDLDIYCSLDLVEDDYYLLC